MTRYLDEGATPQRRGGAGAARGSKAPSRCVMLFAGEPDLLICARRGSPLAIGYGEGEMYVGSDALALGAA